MVPEYSTIMVEAPKKSKEWDIPPGGPAHSEDHRLRQQLVVRIDWPYFTSFQNAAFKRQVMMVSTPRKINTHTPIRTRLF